MALKATIYKADVQISDMHRHYYQNHNLTLARHPSETEERMMVRLLAFVLNASSDLGFGRGLSSSEEPDLWQRGLTGDVEQWIDVGRPDDERLRKACGRAAQVMLYTYGGHSADVWWEQVASRLERFSNLVVYKLAESSTQALAALAARNMVLQCTIDDGIVWLGDDSRTIEINPVKVFPHNY